MSILTEKEREDVYKYWLHSSTLTNEDGLIQLAEKAVLEKVAAWIEPQRSDIPANGAEFADAIRALKDFQ